ncbi:hypothetical protein AFLA_004315 [Aspergillus flavus NRRL3357]|nr:hypothetical protein AFLA_004315 [Aspergillus flavus NRRL3357]
MNRFPGNAIASRGSSRRQPLTNGTIFYVSNSGLIINQDFRNPTQPRQAVYSIVEKLVKGATARDPAIGSS